jgi:signal transduction histidine kinase
MSEQRWMAQTLDTTLAALEQAVEEAKASEARSRTVLADAAHQLRAPMAGIQACAETLLRGVPPESADKLLASMVRETTRAARLVTSLLQIARLDQGEPISLQPCDVVAVCEDEVMRARGLAPQLDIRLVIVGDIPAVPADPKVLHEIVANLVDNARRHAVSTVGVQVHEKDGDVIVRVAEDGPGVPKEQREQIFERFVSLDGRGGSGLGLPIARSYARAMGGDVYYDGGFVLRLTRDLDPA